MDLTDASGNHYFQFCFCFAGTSKRNVLWRASGAERLIELTSRGDFQSASALQKKPQKRWIRIRLYRVADREPRRQSIAQSREFLLNHSPVVDKHRSPVAVGKRRSCKLPDHQFAVGIPSPITRGHFRNTHTKPSRRRKEG